MSAFMDPLPDNVIEWYEENAKAAAEIMLPGTKGHMLANEAVPHLAAEVRRLRTALQKVEAESTGPMHIQERP